MSQASWFTNFLLALNLITVLFTLVGAWALFGGFPNLPEWNYSQLSFWLGILNTVIGILVAVLHMGMTQGWRATAILLGICIFLAGGAELLGVTTGFPFGSYIYTERLGPKFLGHVPYIIPISWFMMLYPSLHLAFAFTSVRWLRPILAAVLLTLWDVAMDPAVTTGFVYWHWLTPGEFYGMPLQNWLGWLVVGWILSALFTWVWRDWQVNRSTVPLLLWLVQGGLMAGLAWILHRPLATLFWGIGATVVVAVWLRWRGGASR